MIPYKIGMLTFEMQPVIYIYLQLTQKWIKDILHAARLIQNIYFNLNKVIFVLPSESLQIFNVFNILPNRWRYWY